MKLKIASYLMILYYTAGILFLPAGDFSTVTDLPKAYNDAFNTDCENEVDNITLIDFVKIQLINFDFIVNNHWARHEQKQQKPFDNNYRSVIQHIAVVPVELMISSGHQAITRMITFDKNSYDYEFIEDVFHPPVTA